MVKFSVTDLFIRRIILLLPNNVKTRRGALLSALAYVFDLRQTIQSLMTMVSRKIMNYYLNWITNSIQFTVNWWIFKKTDSCCWLESVKDNSQFETPKKHLFLLKICIFYFQLFWCWHWMHKIFILHGRQQDIWEPRDQEIHLIKIVQVNHGWTDWLITKKWFIKTLHSAQKFILINWICCLREDSTWIAHEDL